MPTLVFGEAPSASSIVVSIAIPRGFGYAFEFFLRIRPSLHSHGAHEHSEHAVAGMEK